MRTSLFSKTSSMIAGILLLIASLYSYNYYLDDFNSLNAGWSGQMKIGREGYLNFPQSPLILLSTSGGILQYNNLNQSLDTGTSHSYTGAWLAAKMVLTNKMFKASADKPFGFEINLRSNRMAIGGAPTSASEIMFFGWEMVQHLETNFNVYTNSDGLNFANFAQLGIIYKRLPNRSFYTAYVGGVEYELNLTKALRPDGTETNISSFLTNPSTDTALRLSNAVMRMSHLGDTLKFYINPDPAGTSAAPNENLEVLSVPVAWNSNILIAVTGEAKDNGTSIRHYYDWLKVIPPADSATWTIPTGNVVKSTNASDYKDVSIRVTPVINGTNAGINLIEITKPAGLGSWDGGLTLTNNIKVISAFDGSAVPKTNISKVFSFYSNLLTNEVSVSTNAAGDKLWIRLGRQIENGFGDKSVTLSFRMLATNIGAYKFDVSADAVKFDSVLTSFPQTNNATTGPMRSNVTLTVVNLPGQVNGFAAITPNEVFQSGASYYTFTYFIQGDTNNTSSVEQAAIEIPEAFSNCTFSNFNSVLMGSEENYGVNIFRQSIAGISNEVLLFDYSAFSFPSAGLDVISFDVYGSPALGSNFVWSSRVDSVSIKSNSSICATNIIYPKQTVTVNSFNVNATWDYAVIRSENFTPASIPSLSIIPMASVDVIADGENTATETLQRVDVQLLGIRPDAAGYVYLYRDTNGMETNWSGSEQLLGQLPFTAGTLTNQFFITELNQSQSNVQPLVFPTRYWVAVQVTNSTVPVFSNTVGARIVGLGADGPDSGTIESAILLTLAENSTARIDAQQLEFGSLTLISNTVRQGSFNNLFLKFTISNSDPDSTNYFNSISFTNLGTGTAADFGVLSIFMDDGDGLFSTLNDTVVMADADGMQNKVYTAGINPPIAISGVDQKTFFVSINIELNGGIGRTAELQILNTNKIGFADVFQDGSQYIPAITSAAFPLPSVTYAAAIIPAASKPYDFNIQGVSYTSAPQSFSTNQLVDIGFFDAFMDVEETNNQVLTNVAVTTASTGSKALVFGWAYIYKETANTGFNPADDTLLASNAVAAGANFSINLAVSNLTVDQFNPDRFYLVFKLTNHISNAMTEKISFAFTNISGSGPNGGLVTNLNLLGLFSKQMRIDSGEVGVNIITNDVLNYFPKQGSFNNTYLKLVMAGKDADATNYLSYVDIQTNGIAGGASNSHIASVKLLKDLDGDGVFSNGADDTVAVGVLTGAGVCRLSFSTPEAVIGTNAQTYFVGFDLTSDDDSAVGKTFGLKITNGGISFVDGISDGFTQEAFGSGTLNGPSSATNVTISSLLSRPWDFKVIAGVNAAPVSMILSNLTGMSYVDIVADNENPALEKITNLQLAITGKNSGIYGTVSIYIESNDSTSVKAADDILVTNFSIVNPSSIISLPVNLSGISGDQLAPTRIWAALTVTNAANTVYTNTAWVKFTNVLVTGPNSGFLTNFSTATNVTNSTSRIDNLKVFVSGASLLTNSVKQGSFNNTALRMVFTNSDPDAVSYLSTITITNLGTATSADLGNFQFYLDNGDGVFSSVTDSILGVGNMTGKVWNVTFNPQATITNTNILWGVFNVDFSAAAAATVSPQITSITSDMTWSDLYADAYSLVPAVVGASPLPSANTTNSIIPSASQPFDFYLQSINYSSLPQAFSTNQFVPVAFFDAIMDVENTNSQVFTNVQVMLSNPPGQSKSQVTGLAYVYREALNSADFNPAEDVLLGSNAVAAGANFSVSLAYSNTSIDSLVPTRFYLVYRQTNAMTTAAMSNRVAFRITNLLCSGPNNGLFTNTGILTAVSAAARVDSGDVGISIITNSILDYYPKQGSFNNTYLKLTMAGKDADATNFLKWIDVQTNGMAGAVANSHIASVKLFQDNGDGVYSNATDSTVAVGVLSGAGVCRLSFSTPDALIGTNAQTYFVGFDITSDDSNAVGKVFGLIITNGAFAFTDGISDNFAQEAFSTGLSSGPSVSTNVTVSSLFARTWDYKVISSANTAPVSMALSNLTGMSYVDIVADNENPALERITNLQLAIAGKKSDIYGTVSIYLESDGSSSIVSNSDTLITNFAIANPSSIINLAVNLAGISSDPLLPTRIWAALTVTNTASAVYTNTAWVKFTNVMVAGPNAGILQDSYVITNVASTASRIDNMRVYVSGSAMLTNSVRQGSFNNTAIKLVLTNSDPDAVSYLSTIAITNLGTAVAADLGSFQFYLDNGDGAFDDATDSVVGVGAMTAKVWNVTFNPQCTVTNTNILWGVFNVNFAAASGATVTPQITSLSTGMVWSDLYADVYNQTPSVIGSSPLPGVNTTNSVIPFTSMPYDFYVRAVDYSSMPVSFTTNQYVTVGKFDIFRDVENTNTEVFLGAQVKLASTGIKTHVTGMAYLYKEVTNSGFALSNDLLIGSNAVVAGADFSIASAWSNVSFDGTAPDSFYLVYRHTNSIFSSMTDVISFQVTNMLCSGPDGGLFTNIALLAAAQSAQARIDSPFVEVITITNAIDTYQPSQASFNHTYLKIVLSNRDPDAVAYLSSLDVETNIFTSVNLVVGHIPFVKVFDASSNIIASKTMSTGSVTMSFGSPIEITGAAATELYIGYDVSGTTSVTNKTFGLMMTNGSLKFVDGIADGFVQATSVSNNYAGPAVMTNVKIKPFNVEPWDLYIEDAGGASVVSMGVSNIYGLTWFDIVSDENESPTAQRLTNITVAVAGAGVNAAGQITVHRTTSSAGAVFTASTAVATNNFAGSGTVQISLNENLLSGKSSPSKTRFWIGVNITNASANVFTNTISVIPTAIAGMGPDGSNGFAVVSNMGLFTNIPSLKTRIDTYNVYVRAFDAAISSNVNEGSATNISMRLEMSNEDPDGPYWLDRLTLTNLGNAGPGDLSEYRLYYDNGDGTNDVANDILVLRSEVLGANQQYSLDKISALPFLVTNRVANFWGMYSVKLGATIGNTAVLKIAGASSVKLTNTLSDGYSRSVTVGGVFPMPASMITQTLVPKPADPSPFDFFIRTVDYSPAPAVFSTQQVLVGSLVLFRDGATGEPEGLLDVDVGVTGVTAGLSGIARLWRERTNEDAFSALDDELVSSVVVVDGSDIRFSPNLTNVTALSYPGDRFYLTFELTNAMAAASACTVSMKFTNINVSGTNTAVTNINMVANTALFAASSRVMMVNDPELDILAIGAPTNRGFSLFPVQGDIRDCMLEIVMQGRDADGTNFIDYVDVMTNGLSDLNLGLPGLPQLYLYEDTNGDGNFSRVTDKLGASADFLTGSARLTLSPSMKVVGTNVRRLFLAYDVNVSDAMVGKVVGLKIADIGFGDGWSDLLDQTAMTADAKSGPAVDVGRTILSINEKVWDVKVTSAKWTAPAFGVTNVEADVLDFTMYREHSLNGDEYLTGIIITNMSSGGNYSGVLKLYSNTSLGTRATAGFIGSWTNTSADILQTLGFASNAPSDQADDATRYFLTWTPESFISTVTNRWQISGFYGYGFNTVPATSNVEVENVDFLSALAPTALNLESNSVSISYIPVLPTIVTQGNANVLTARVLMNALDADASFTLKKLVFRLNASGSDAVMQQNIIAKLYLDNGTSNAVYDAGDTAVGSALFAGGIATVIFNNDVAVTSGGASFLMAVDVKDAAPAAESFSVSFVPADQNGFENIASGGAGSVVLIGSWAVTNTADAEVMPKEAGSGDLLSAYNTIIRDCESSRETCRIQLSDEAAAQGEWNAVVFDIFGYKVKEWTLDDRSAIWDGTDQKGKKVPSGFYLFNMSSAKDSKYFKVAVERCE